MRVLPALALLASLSVSQIFGPEDRQPYTRTSPNGRWVLSVDPSHRDGSGTATCKLTRDASVVWSGQKPWTFWDSLVTDEGFVAGYSYSKDGVRQLGGGDFHAVIVAPDGSVKLDEVHPRTTSNFLHEPSNPLARGVFEHAGLHRVVFRIADPDINRRHEEWWSFELPDAREVWRRRPADKAKDVGDSIVCVAEIPGTPLVAIQWRVFDWPRIGFRCVVLDAGLEPVWKSELLDEFDGKAPGKLDESLRSIYQRGSISSGPGANRFSYRLAKEQLSAVFVVERSGEAWAVREVAREKVVHAEESVAVPLFAEMPIATLAERGDVLLLSPVVGSKAGHDEIAKPGAAAIDVFGRVLLQDETGGAVHVFDAQGKRLFVCRPDPKDFEHPSSIAQLAATRDGGVIVERDISQFVRFGTDGRRLGALEVPGVSRSLVYSPVRPRAYLGRSGAGFVELDEKLAPGATFERMPDGSWIVGGDDPSVAADGAVAVVSSGKLFHQGGALVLFERADPKESRSIPLPPDVPTNRLVLGAKWAAVSGFGRDALLVARSGDRMLRLSMPNGSAGGRYGRFGFDPVTGDLLFFDIADRRIRRFALP